MRDLHSYRCHRSGLTFSPEYHWSSGSNADPDPANELTMKDRAGVALGEGATCVAYPGEWENFNGYGGVGLISSCSR